MSIRTFITSEHKSGKSAGTTRYGVVPITSIPTPTVTLLTGNIRLGLRMPNIFESEMLATDRFTNTGQILTLM